MTYFQLDPMHLQPGEEQFTPSIVASLVEDGILRQVSMQVEHRVVVKTRHGTTHRFPIKKGRAAAIETGRVYVDTASPFYAGSNVTVECRELGDWHDIELEECEEG